MASVNKVILVGNVGQDPELSEAKGYAIARFSLATTRKSKDGAEETEWHSCKAFGKLAEIIGSYVTRGKQLYIEGRLQTSKWEKDGVKHSRTEIIVEQMQMLGSRAAEAEGSAPAPQQQQRRPAPKRQAAPQPVDDFGGGDDIPF
jgi:single-strand DNA-binding protein